MRVEQIPAIEARPWIMLWHYAHRMPCVEWAFGLFDASELRGVVTYGPPVSPHLCRGVCGEPYADRVIELNRLCVEGGTRNGASSLVGGSLRLMPAPRIVVSYADTSAGHVGYVYQATNWIYTGTTDDGRKTPRPDRIVSDGRHGRHEARIGDGDKVDTAIGALVYRKPKHRYVFFCGTRRDCKAMRKALAYDVKPYPKGDTRRYEPEQQIHKQQVML